MLIFAFCGDKKEQLDKVEQNQQISYNFRSQFLFFYVHDEFGMLLL